jgi:hypothetical protein
MVDYIGPSVSLIGVFVGSFLTWLATGQHSRKQDIAANEETAAILIGELKRIQRHFDYGSLYAQDFDEGFDGNLRTAIAMYGSIKTLDVGLLKFGFLGPLVVERSMELSFLIRNHDTLAHHLREESLHSKALVSHRERYLAELARRARGISDLSSAIIGLISNKFPTASERITDVRKT